MLLVNVWFFYRQFQVDEFFALVRSGPGAAAAERVKADPWLATRAEVVMVEQGSETLTFDTRETALHQAARSCDVTLCQALLESGADVHAESASRYRPLHYAVAANKPTTNEVARLLLEAGADPRVTNGNGRSALDQCPKENTELRAILTASYPPAPARKKAPWSILDHKLLANAFIIALMVMVFMQMPRQVK